MTFGFSVLYYNQKEKGENKMLTREEMYKIFEDTYEKVRYMNRNAEYEDVMATVEDEIAEMFGRRCGEDVEFFDDWYNEQMDLYYSFDE